MTNSSLDGAYLLDSPIEYQCAVLPPPLVNLSYATLELTHDGTGLSVIWPSMNGGCTLSGASVGPDGSFDLECLYAGDCNEYYRLAGTFLSTTTFVAEFSVHFEPSPGQSCLDCADYTLNVTGTR